MSSEHKLMLIGPTPFQALHVASLYHLSTSLDCLLVSLRLLACLFLFISFFLCLFACPFSAWIRVVFCVPSYLLPAHLPLVYACLFSHCPSVLLVYRLSLWIPLCLSLSACQSVSLCLSVSLPACLSICLPVCISVSLFLYLSACLPVCLSLFQSVPPPVYSCATRLTVCLSLYLLACLSDRQPALPLFACLFVCLHMSACRPACLFTCLPVCVWGPFTETYEVISNRPFWHLIWRCAQVFTVI